MTPAERAAAWSTLSWRLRQAEATEDAGASAHYARLALEAYEALRADDEARVTGVLRPGYEDDTRALQALADELCAVTEALPDEVLAEDRSLADSVRMLKVQATELACRLVERDARRCGTCRWWEGRRGHDDPR